MGGPSFFLSTGSQDHAEPKSAVYRECDARQGRVVLASEALVAEHFVV